MRLTALRHPKDIPKPMNSKHINQKPDPPNDIYPNSKKTAILSLQKMENATTRERTPSRTVAQYKSPLTAPALTTSLS